MTKLLGRLRGRRRRVKQRWRLESPRMVAECTKGSREGCRFAIDGRFEQQLAAFSPAGARFYISHGLDTLLEHLREVLQIPPSSKLMRRPDRVVVWGFAAHDA